MGMAARGKLHLNRPAAVQQGQMLQARLPGTLSRQLAQRGLTRRLRVWQCRAKRQPLPESSDCLGTSDGLGLPEVLTGCIMGLPRMVCVHGMCSLRLMSSIWAAAAGAARERRESQACLLLSSMQAARRRQAPNGSVTQRVERVARASSGKHGCCRDRASKSLTYSHWKQS